MNRPKIPPEERAKLTARAAMASIAMALILIGLIGAGVNFRRNRRKRY